MSSSQSSLSSLSPIGPPTPFDEEYVIAISFRQCRYIVTSMFDYQAFDDPRRAKEAGAFLFLYYFSRMLMLLTYALLLILWIRLYHNVFKVKQAIFKWNHFTTYIFGTIQLFYISLIISMAHFMINDINKFKFLSRYVYGSFLIGYTIILALGFLVFGVLLWLSSRGSSVSLNNRILFISLILVIILITHIIYLSTVVLITTGELWWFRILDTVIFVVLEMGVAFLLHKKPVNKRASRNNTNGGETPVSPRSKSYTPKSKTNSGPHSRPTPTTRKNGGDVDEVVDLDEDDDDETTTNDSSHFSNIQIDSIQMTNLAHHTNNTNSQKQKEREKEKDGEKDQQQDESGDGQDSENVHHHHHDDTYNNNSSSLKRERERERVLEKEGGVGLELVCINRFLQSSMVKPTKLLIVLLVLLVVWDDCHHDAMVDAIYQEPYSFKGKYNVNDIGSFGFLSGGYFDVNIQVENPSDSSPPPIFMACTQQEYNDKFDNYCTLKPNCTFTQQLNSSSNSSISHIKGSIKDTDYYFFVITQCDATYYYTVSYAFYNPGGNHLSYQFIPLPIILMVFTGIWVLLTALWSINWIQNRNQNVKLHKVITLYPFSKLSMIVYSLGYWRYLQSYGAVGIGVLIFYWIFYIIFKVISCVVLLFIATGWGICKGRFEHLRKALYIIIILLTATLALGAFLGGFFTSDANVRLLRAQIAEAQNNNAKSVSVDQSSSDAHEHEMQTIPPNPTLEKDPEAPSQDINTAKPNSTRDDDKALNLSLLNDKLHMFVAFKWIMLVYLTCVIVIQFLSAAFPFGWVFEFFMLLVETVMFICIGVTFRLRKQKKYYEFVDE
ncbi:hypothetical protein DFA_03680 [Cavenderia fasciculata]|uniref:GOST seven transmembrane domain-containing protein n=1 Tax=Cavenderia fasciculata TaxID=261658 RepID=F4Q1P3_CACFS|nr:uncharacterized protein DFA_03680 [Cavenderia fasciculata]EGG18193.1 hypothetical protein DFA_03680 [Cavenderia fasciculata]|eukprot:XP_004357016.1 hypothetical protein DFA_03680 [Cavenderia fasciculata]